MWLPVCPADNRIVPFDGGARFMRPQARRGHPRGALALLAALCTLALSAFNLGMPTGSEHSRELAETSEIVPSSPGPGSDDTSEFLVGSVGVGVFLPESIGSEFNWKDAETRDVLKAVESALDWWAAQEPRARISFVTEAHLAVRVTDEPVKDTLNRDAFWIREVLSGFGYNESDPWSQAQHFNNDLRNRTGTDWAYSVFIAKGDTGAFADGKYAHGDYGGPWLTFSYAAATPRTDAMNLAMLYTAHETGHIFYATDEYNGATENSGYFDCPDSEGFDGIMGPNMTMAVSPGTRCQLGWVDADGNGILDVLDHPPDTYLEGVGPESADCQLRLRGSATVVASPNLNTRGPRNSVTVSRIARVEYRVDGGTWRDARPADGAFDDFEETFSVVTPLLAPGPHALDVRALSTEGVADDSPAHATGPTIPTFCSSVDPLPPELDSPRLAVSAIGLGNIARVELWYLVESRPAQLYAEDRAAPWSWDFDAAVAGGPGNYSFFSVALNEDGDREVPPPEPDTTVLVEWQESQEWPSWTPAVFVVGAIAAVTLTVVWLRHHRRRRNSE